MSNNDKKKLRTSTKIVQAGMNTKINYSVPNIPVYNASTILHENIEKYRENKENSYARYGTPTSDALISAISSLYNSEGAVLSSSGLSSCMLAILTFAKSDNHILITDSVYGSTREFIKNILPRYKINYEFFDPKINARNIKKLFKKNTSLIYLESPGSLTFEVQDIAGIAKAAKTKNITVITDNSWATALGMNCFDIGVDVVIESLTKYTSGHSDLIMGCLISNGNYLKKIKYTSRLFGQRSSSNDIFLALRGLRTVELRLQKSFSSSLIVAEWLSNQNEVEKVIHPARNDHPENYIYKTNYKMGSGLFAFILKTKDKRLSDKFINSLNLFGIGASWGGFESLVSYSDIQNIRSFNYYQNKVIIRLAIGLEDPKDLIDDINNAFIQMNRN